MAAKPPGMGKQLLTVVLGTWIAVVAAGGVLYALARSGKISMAASGERTSAEGQNAKAMREIALEPILANLADEGGHAYVRLGLRVEVEADPAPSESAAADTKSADAATAPSNGAKAGSSDLESSIRDTVLAVLGRQTSANLLGPDGKEHLKIELKEAIERGGVRVDVKDLFFTDFLVQI